MSGTLTTLAGICKDMWVKSQASLPGWQNSVLYSLIEKDSSLGGAHIIVPVKHGNVEASSATFTVAQTAAAANSSQNARFDVTTKRHYSLARVEGEVARATRSEGLMSIAKAIVQEMQSAYECEVRRANQRLYRPGTGELQVIIPAGSVGGALTLQLPAEPLGSTNYPCAHLFEVGQLVTGALTFAAPNAARVGGNRLVGVNRTTGIITGTGNWNAVPAALADGDGLCLQGDYVLAGDMLCIDGFESWCPAAVPAPAALFYGVDRALNPERLCGVRYDAFTAGDTLEEGLIKGAALFLANGGIKSGEYIGILNPAQWALLEMSLGSDKRFNKILAKGDNGQEIATLGFDAIELLCGGKRINFVQDPDCPYNVAWIFDRKSPLLCSMGTFPGTLGVDIDGVEFLRLAAADEYEVRIGGYPQMIMRDPGAICRIRIAA